MTLIHDVLRCLVFDDKHTPADDPQVPLRKKALLEKFHQHQDIDLKQLPTIKLKLAEKAAVMAELEELLDLPELEAFREHHITIGKEALHKILADNLCASIQSDIASSLNTAVTNSIKKPFYQAYHRNPDFESNEALQDLLYEKLPTVTSKIVFIALKDLAQFIRTSRWLISSETERKAHAETLFEKLLVQAALHLTCDHPSPRLAGEVNGFALATQRLALSMQDLLSKETLTKIDHIEVFDLNGINLKYSFKNAFTTAMSNRSKHLYVSLIILFQFLFLLNHCYNLYKNTMMNADEFDREKNLVIALGGLSTFLIAAMVASPSPLLQRGQTLSTMPLKPELNSDPAPGEDQWLSQAKQYLKTDENFKKLSFKDKNARIVYSVKQGLALTKDEKDHAENMILINLFIAFENLFQVHVEAKNQTMMEHANDTLDQVISWIHENKAYQLSSTVSIRVALIEQIGQLLKLASYKPSSERLYALAEEFLRHMNMSVINQYTTKALLTILQPWKINTPITARQYLSFINSNPSLRISKQMLASVQPLMDFILTNKTIIKDEIQRRHCAATHMRLFIDGAALATIFSPIKLRKYIATNAYLIQVAGIAKKLSPLLTKAQLLSLKEIKQFDLQDFNFRHTALEGMRSTLTMHYRLLLPLISFLISVAGYCLFVVEDSLLAFFGFNMAVIVGLTMPSLFEHHPDILELSRALSARLPLQGLEWLDDFEETPLPEPKVAPASPEKSPSPPPLAVSVPAVPPVAAKPRVMTDWKKVSEQLTKKYHQFKESLATESDAAKNLFNTTNSDKKAKMLALLKHLQNNPENFYNETSQSLHHEIIENYILDECNNKILTSGEAKIVRGIQPPPPVEVVPLPVAAPAPAPEAPMIPFPLVSSSSSSAATKKPSTKAYAKISPDIHQARLAGNAHRYGPHNAPLPPSDLHYLAMKFDLLDLCERLKKLFPLTKDRINRIRNGLLHHDASIEMNLKFDTYQGLLRDFAAHYKPDNINPAAGLLRSPMADPQAWIMRERTQNTIEGITPIEYFNERCQSIVRFYDEMIHQIELKKSPSLPRKAMMMSVIEIGVLFSHMVLEHQNMSLLMPMEQVKLFTDFRKSFCHVDSEAKLQQIQQNLQSIYEIVTGIVQPEQSSRLAAVFNKS